MFLQPPLPWLYFPERNTFWCCQVFSVDLVVRRHRRDERRVLSKKSYYALAHAVSMMVAPKQAKSLQVYYSSMIRTDVYNIVGWEHLRK